MNTTRGLDPCDQVLDGSLLATRRLLKQTVEHSTDKAYIKVINRPSAVGLTPFQLAVQFGLIDLSTFTKA